MEHSTVSPGNNGSVSESEMTFENTVGTEARCPRHSLSAIKFVTAPEGRESNATDSVVFVAEVMDHAEGRV